MVNVFTPDQACQPLYKKAYRNRLKASHEAAGVAFTPHNRSYLENMDEKRFEKHVSRLIHDRIWPLFPIVSDELRKELGSFNASRYQLSEEKDGVIQVTML